MMTMIVQEWLTISIVTIAAVYTGRELLRQFGVGSKGASPSCSSCPSGCTPEAAHQDDALIQISRKKLEDAPPEP